MLQSSADSVAQSFYYATIRDLKKPAHQCSDEASPIMLLPVPGTIAETEPFTAVNLGPLLGQGGSGHVYRGTWNGATVAVKVCQSVMSEHMAVARRNVIFQILLFVSRFQPTCMFAGLTSIADCPASIVAQLCTAPAVYLLFGTSICCKAAFVKIVLVVSSMCMCVCVGGGGTACKGG